MINSASRKSGPFVGTGLVSTFPFDFKVFSSSDVVVTMVDSSNVETVLANISDYTVSLNADQDASPGGNVVLVSALASGYSLVLSSDVPALQQVDITNLGGFYPKVIVSALDRLTILVQQALESITRSLKLPISASSGVSTTLPVPSANQVIGWSSDANALTNFDPSSLVTSIVGATYIVDTFSGDGSTKDFTLSGVCGSEALARVTISKVLSDPISEYTISKVGSTSRISFVSAPAAGSSNIKVVYGQALPGISSSSIAGNLTVAGYAAISVSSSSPALTVTQSGSGYGISTNGAIYVATASSQTPLFVNYTGGGSYLAELKQAGVSKFYVDTTGAAVFAGEITAAGVKVSGGFYSSDSSILSIYQGVTDAQYVSMYGGSTASTANGAAILLYGISGAFPGDVRIYGSNDATVKGSVTFVASGSRCGQFDGPTGTFSITATTAAINSSATITIANLQAGLITSTTGAVVTGTLPTGTLMDGGFKDPFGNQAIEWSVINTGGNNFVVAAGASHTVVGSMTVSGGTSGRFLSRRTTTTTWITYRIA